MSRIQKVFFLCAAVVFLQTLPGHAKDKIVVASVYIPLMIEKDGSGLFIDLAKEIGARTGIDFVFDVLPARRAVLEYEKGNVDALFPATSRSTALKGTRTKAIYVRRDYAFVRNGEIPPKNLKEMEGLSVIINPKYDQNSKLLLNNKIRKVKGANDVANMKMLAAKRGDVLIVEERSGVEAMKQARVKGLKYDASSPITSVDAFFIFQVGNEGKILAERVSAAIGEIVSDGTYLSLFGVKKP